MTPEYLNELADLADPGKLWRASCDQEQQPDGGWCYMLRNEPHEVPMKHTMRVDATTPVKRCQCGYPMPCAQTVPITFCRA